MCLLFPSSSDYLQKFQQISSLLLKLFLVLNLITHFSKFLVVLVILTYVLTILTSFLSDPPSVFFLDYSPAHKGYRCLSSSGWIYVAKSVTFNENDFFYSTLFTQPNTSHQSFIHKFSCPSYVLHYCPPVSPPSTHLPTSSSQRHISSFANMSNTFTVVVTDTPMALTLSVSNALSDNACSSFSNSTTGFASLPSYPATGTTVPIIDNMVSTPCMHVV